MGRRRSRRTALVGSSVDPLDVTVVAVRAVDGDVIAIPTRDRSIGVGETIYSIGRPDRLRRPEAATETTSVPSGD